MYNVFSSRRFKGTVSRDFLSSIIVTLCSQNTIWYVDEHDYFRLLSLKFKIVGIA